MECPTVKMTGIGLPSFLTLNNVGPPDLNSVWLPHEGAHALLSTEREYSIAHRISFASKRFRSQNPEASFIRTHHLASAYADHRTWSTSSKTNPMPWSSSLDTCTSPSPHLFYEPALRSLHAFLPFLILSKAFALSKPQGLLIAGSGCLNVTSPWICS